MKTCVAMRYFFLVWVSFRSLYNRKNENHKMLGTAQKR